VEIETGMGNNNYHQDVFSTQTYEESEDMSQLDFIMHGVHKFGLNSRDFHALENIPERDLS
jgi:hypothetical protein